MNANQLKIALLGIILFPAYLITIGLRKKN